MEMFKSVRGRIRSLRGRLTGGGLAAVLLLSTIGFTVPAQPALANDINVTQHGVRNDGVDSTTALRNLIGSGNTSLLFPTGTYRFSAISLPANTKLTFASGAKVLPSSGSTANFFTVSGNGVSVIGGAFDGQGAAGNVVSGSGRSSLLVDGVSAVGMRGSTVNLSGVTSSTIRNTSSVGSEYGIVLSSSSYVTLDSNYSNNMLRDGILLYSGSRFITVSNNTAERFSARGAPDTGRAGIHMYGCSDITVFGNTIRNGLYDAEGIRFRDTERFDCFNNLVDGTGGAGIAVTSMGDWYNSLGLIGGDGTIRNNTVRNNGIRGIASVYTNPRFENTHLFVKPVRIMNNVIENTWLDSRWHVDTADAIHSASRDSVVVNNSITGSTGFGVRIGSGGARTLVADNGIRTVRNAGVATWAQNSTVVRNVINGVSNGPGISNSGTMYAEGNSVTSAASTSSTSNTGKLSGDSTAPTVSSNILTSYNAGQTFTVSGADSGTGVAALMVRVNSAPVRAYHGTSVTLDVGTAGTHTVTYWSMDRAGNVSATQSRTYTVGSLSAPTEPAPAPEPAPTVAAPANLAGSGVESSGSSIVSLAWSDRSTNENGFVVERAYELDGARHAWVVIDTLPANSTTYADRVTLGSIYHYRVRAFAGSGSSIVYSAYSNEARIVSPGGTTTPAPVVATPLPAAPTALSATPTHIRTVQMRWTDNASNETGYEIWLNRRGVWNLYDLVPADTTSYTTKRIPRGEYQLRVRAVNAAGASAFSNTVTLSVK
jgi:hypothetical protein